MKLRSIINEETPLIGIEPSAILGFRDEYPDLADNDIKEDTAMIAKNSMMVDEYISREYKAGRIKRESFSGKKTKVLLHAHCQQKAISSSSYTIDILSIPESFSVREILQAVAEWPGHLAMKRSIELATSIGEMVLFLRSGLLRMM